MWKKVLYLMGAVMILLSCLGLFNNIRKLGQAPVVKEDLIAEGTITEKEVTELRHATGILISTDYKLRYSFVAEDGKTYHDSDTITEDELSRFKRLSEGETIPVRYYSHMPIISASPFGYYRSVDTVKETSFASSVAFCVCFAVIGIGMIVCTVLFVVDEPQAASVPRRNDLFSNAPSV